MKKCKIRWKRGCACLAALALAAGSVNVPVAAAANAFGQEKQQGQNNSPSGEIFTGETECVAVNESGLSNDELFEGYLNQLFYGSGISTYSLDNFNLSGLDNDERALYNAAKAVLLEIADGTRTKTDEIPLEDITINYETTGDSSTAEEELGNFLGSKIRKVMNMILADCPYELYWFGKTKGYQFSYCYSVSGNTYTIKNLELSFSVASDYAQKSGENTYNQYLIDTTQVERAKAAKAKADAIVAKHASLGDYDKLYAYLQEICDLTEYNKAAAGTGSAATGIDPWQLVYVFDGDTTTNVVCEGYSKAFAYLCEKSTFAGDINCCIVTGTLQGDGDSAGGGHMWNIVTMEDGKSYLVDVTNCDTGSVGAPDLLFLAGGLSGSAEEGYTFTRESQHVNFAYNDETKALYPNSVLELSTESYDKDKKVQDELTIREISDKKTYGDGSFELSTEGGSGTGAITYSVPDNNGVLSVEGNTASVIGAGTVVITAVKAGSDEYKPAKATYELTVAKKSLKPSVSGTVTKKYDGTISVDKATENTLAIVLDGVLESDKSKIQATASFEYEDAAVGDNKNVIAKNITLSGDAASNYELDLSADSDTISASVGKIEAAETSGDSTGDTTGGNTSGNTGGNTGGSTSGNTGGNTGGTTGGNTGGNTGGTTGGNTGSNTPVPTTPAPVTPAPATPVSATPAPTVPTPEPVQDTVKTDTVTNPDGSVTKTVTETDDSGKVVQVTETTTNTDGTVKEVVNRTGTNSKNKEVNITTTTNINKDGSIVNVTKKTAIENIASNVIATVTTVTSPDKAAIAAASVTMTVRSGNKSTLSKSVIDQIAEAAENANTKITVTVKDSSGNVKYTVKTATADLTTGKKLYIYQLNTKTGEYIMVNAEVYTLDDKGNIEVSMKDNKTYELVSEKESKRINKNILNTVKAKKTSASIKKGKKTQFTLSGKLNTANVKGIRYTSSKKAVAAISSKGKITAKKSGTVVMKAKVTLKNGTKKTVSMKVKVK